MSIIRKIRSEYKNWTAFIIKTLPSGYIGDVLRKRYWTKRLKKVGDNAAFWRMSDIVSGDKVEIGNNFAQGQYVIIDSTDSYGIYIGNDVGIAKGSFIRAANHEYGSRDIPINKQGHSCKQVEYKSKLYSIVIEDDVWIGQNSMILSGVKIGKGSVIMVGSVVWIEDIPPYSIVAGNPASIIGKRGAAI